MAFFQCLTAAGLVSQEKWLIPVRGSSCAARVASNYHSRGVQNGASQRSAIKQPIRRRPLNAAGYGLVALFRSTRTPSPGLPVRRDVTRSPAFRAWSGGCPDDAEQWAVHCLSGEPKTNRRPLEGTVESGRLNIICPLWREEGHTPLRAQNRFRLVV
jgi:hypothetical protein